MKKDKVYYLRMAMGLSQVDFSSIYNIPIRTIQDWEAQRRTYPPYVYELLEYRVFDDILETYYNEQYHEIIEQYITHLTQDDIERVRYILDRKGITDIFQQLSL